MKTRLDYKGRLLTAYQFHTCETIDELTGVDELTGKNKEMRL